MTEEKKNLLEKVHEDFFDVTMKDYDHKRLQNYVVDDVMGYGTTVDEKIFGLKGLQELVMLQKEQAKDVDIQYTVTPVQRIITNNETVAIYTDEIELSMQLGEGKNEFTVRLSTILEFQHGEWKIIHWHGSKPVDSEGDTWHKDEWKKKNEELKKLVEEKTADLIIKNSELEIEAALERVRTVAMGMQKPDDILDVCKIISNQLELLNISNIRNVQVAIIDEPRKNYLNYQYFTAYSKQVFEETEYENHPTSQAMVSELQKSANSFFTGSLQNEQLKSFIDWRKKYNQFPDPLLDQSSAVYYYFYSIGMGGLGLTTYKEINNEELEIFKRFHKVFKLSYQRYKDIEKAEAQAREAQIEASLERLRSRSMAMQESHELADLSLELVKQVQDLGIDTWFCAFNINDEDGLGSMEWGSNGQGTFPKYRTPREGVFLKYYEAGQGGETLMINEIDEKECPSHYEYLCSLPGVGEQLLKIKDAGIPFPTSQIDHVAFFKYGYILFITFEPAPEAHDIFKRFAKVFEQTYTRFLDLQKAEAQTREAQIESALERVRARALAMQQPEELKDVADVMRREMGLLGVDELETSSIYIYDKSDENAECWYAIKDIRDKEKNLISDYFPLNFNDTRVGREMLKFYNSGMKKTSIYMTGAPRIEWIRYCEERSEKLQGYYGDAIPDRTYHLYKFSHGAIGAATAGDISDENWSLLKRAASVFSLAYSRFKDLAQARLDLKRLKEAKKKAEDALANLKSTQAQLIHAEKMASLGELTAGIAHEIQNPLNFVNNFSEVNRELIAEMREEIENGDLEEVKAIAGDIEQNEEKISHHGKRADEIVKGMLQHSRTSSGQKELTDLNALADEYLRLAYHGLRAKDKSLPGRQAGFNADFKIDLDDSLPLVKVIPQDIGRVLLNLINNAFYAVSVKTRHALSQPQALSQHEYKPLVTLTTLKLDNRIEISVKDNGNGIPADIKDKIFQPFFTTKPTGQGTGLGLSLSYDIIQAHGGDMQVETRKGQETTFIVTLPV